MKNLTWGTGPITPKTSAVRPPQDKAAGFARTISWRVKYERSLASSAAREAHLRSLMGLPAVRNLRDDESNQ